MLREKLQKKLRVKQLGPKEWKFEFPTAVRRLDDKFDHGIDLMDEGDNREAEKIFRAVIKACPLHIDAHHHLAMLLFDRGEILPAIRTWGKAVDIGLKAVLGSTASAQPPASALVCLPCITVGKP